MANIDVNTHHSGICCKHDDYDEEKACDVTPGPLQRSREHVHLGVQPEQAPKFQGGQQHQKGDQILEH